MPIEDEHDHGTTESRKEIEEYWTPARRRAAKTREHVPAAPLPESPAPERDPPVRQRGRSLASPTPTPSRLHVDAAPAPIPHDRIAFPPYVTVGKLFFRADHEAYTGSACVIGRSLLLTAAHNLYQDRVWSDRILFTPAAWDDYGSFGDWTWSRCWVRDAWHQREADGVDVGLIRTEPRGHERVEIGDRVGWLGYGYGGRPGAGTEWLDIGYPRNYGNTLRMWSQRGSYTRTLDDGAVVGMTGQLGSGTSGGPWLVWDENFEPWVNGLHGFHTRNHPGEVFSPYFDLAMHQFIQRHV